MSAATVAALELLREVARLRGGLRRALALARRATERAFVMQHRAEDLRRAWLLDRQTIAGMARSHELTYLDMRIYQRMEVQALLERDRTRRLAARLVEEVLQLHESMAAQAVLLSTSAAGYQARAERAEVEVARLTADPWRTDLPEPGVDVLVELDDEERHLAVGHLDGGDAGRWYLRCGPSVAPYYPRVLTRVEDCVLRWRPLP
jgi:hypothetical protein